MNYITVDGGTTNTRISIVRGHKIICTKKYSIGAGNDDEKNIRTVLKDGICELLKKTGLKTDDIECVLVSGAIISETGLVWLKHIPVPCGVTELAENLRFMRFEDIAPIKFAFVQGVKTVGDTYEDIDMMRGEETELMGICDKPREDTLYVLPGTHSKHISVDKDSRIYDISTEFTGEIIAAVSKHTLLRKSIDLSNSKIDEGYLKEGYEYALKKGINSAFFKARVLAVMLGFDNNCVSSFFVGAALTYEIQNIIKSPKKRVVIGGRYELKRPMSILLKANTSKEIAELSDEVADTATIYGLVKIYELYLG